MASYADGRKNTIGFFYTLGGTAVSWVSKLQKIIALSTTDVEYVAVTEATKEMIWLQSFLEELGYKYEKMCCIVTVLVVFIWQRILFIMLRQSIYRCYITS